MEFGRGTVRAVKNRAGALIGYKALLPRELSIPPSGCRNPDEYQEPIGPRFNTEAEARTLLDAAIVEKLESRDVKHGLPLSHYVEAEIRARLQDARRKYETAARANRAVSTWRSIDRLWLSGEAWYNWPPQAIETADLQAWISYLQDEAEGRSGEPLSGHFIRNCARLVKAALGRVSGPNPARDLKLPPKGAPSAPHLELPAQRRLFGAPEEAIPERHRVKAGCGTGAGLRIGELLAFEADDVHLYAADPHLIVRYGGPDRSPTKGRRSRRVELFEPALGFWRIWMERYYRGGRLVFGGPSDGYQKSWPELFPDWAAVARVPRLSSHIMRHTYAVSMLSGTWGYEPQSLEFVSQQLGHADTQTTERYYGEFEAETWRHQVRRMTGREQVQALRPITAEELLRPGVASDASACESAEQPCKAFRSPSFTQSSQLEAEKAAPDASAHQRLREAAEGFGAALTSGDPLMIAKAVTLMTVALEVADEAEVTDRARRALGRAG